MAQAGFPWHSDTQTHEAPQLSEKDGKLVLHAPKSDSILNDATNTKSVSFPIIENKQKTNGSIKRRSDSIKSNAIGRQSVRFQPDPPRSRAPAQRIPVRTIPAWVQDADEDDLVEASQLLPNSPDTALVAQHNSSPSQPRGGYPVSSGKRRSEPTSRWVSFARASAYPRENFRGEKVDAEWLNENFTDYSKPWLADHNDDDAEDGSDKYHAFRRKRRSWYKRVHFAIMRNPFIPLGLRAFVITFALIAMALGASIHHENNIIERCISQPQGARDTFCNNKVGQGVVNYDRDPSALMAIIVDVVAIIYSLYITYDEYFSKPLGLRPPGAKVRLVLLDLFFIVFQSANESLAFNSLTVDRGPCKASDTTMRFANICHRARALSSVLLISLIAWLLTFSVSILRLVERIGAR